ncbi:hypothetical protein WMY93_012667 [Mugilogobius chulae]|uniref:Uncharacterized protein n=1 Tax=Mugilogobius chulae TaxID=88201 RepID=A0AAW0NXQ8_9GOBI
MDEEMSYRYDKSQVFPSEPPGAPYCHILHSTKPSRHNKAINVQQRIPDASSGKPTTSKCRRLTCSRGSSLRVWNSGSLRSCYPVESLGLKVNCAS